MTGKPIPMVERWKGDDLFDGFTYKTAKRNRVMIHHENENSGMICLKIPEVVRKDIKTKFYPEMSSEIYENLHITLSFLGDFRTQNPTSMIEACEMAAALVGPIQGKLAGVARFVAESGDLDPVVALFDCPQIPLLFHLLQYSLRENGVAFHEDHGFTPHVTLAYLPKDKPITVQETEPIEITFPCIYLALGDKWIEFPLMGVHETEDDDGKHY